MASFPPGMSALSTLLGRWAGGEGATEVYGEIRQDEKDLEDEEELGEEAGDGQDDLEGGSRWLRRGSTVVLGSPISITPARTRTMDEGAAERRTQELRPDINLTSPISIVSPRARDVEEEDRLASPSPSLLANSPKPGVPLPEDDGNGDLRRRLVELSRSVTDEKERARQMHALMTESYRIKTKNVPPSPALLSSTPTVPSQLVTPPPSPGTASLAQISSSWPAAYAFRPKARPPQPILSPSDLAPSFSTSNPTSRGCPHYIRNNKLQCVTCNKWYPCRLCHDAVETHTLPRTLTKSMLCTLCSTVQPVAQDCCNCNARMAAYYCDKCKLWDSSRKNYHCDDCGICRIGEGLGKDFFHCAKCATCLDVRLKGNHRCIERSLSCDCPICGEFLFESRETVVFMQCGHSIHSSCLEAHKRTSYRCPTCARTITNMTVAFRALTLEIERTPLPAPYNTWTSIISCNDCSAKSSVPFHVLGHICGVCGSGNTNVVSVRKDGGGAEGDVDGAAGAASVSTTAEEVDAMMERAREAVREVREAGIGRGGRYDDGWNGEMEEEGRNIFGWRGLGVDVGIFGTPDVGEDGEEGSGGESEEEEDEEEDDDDDEDEEDEGEDEDEDDPFFLIGHI